jgi:hypothetical protein
MCIVGSPRPRHAECIATLHALLKVIPRVNSAMGRRLAYALHDTYHIGVSLRGEICGTSAQLSYLVYLIKIQR